MIARPVLPCFDAGVPTLTPADLTFADSAPNRVVVEHPIAADPATIWAVIIDNPGWSQWYPTMTSCVDTSSQIHGVGSTRAVKVGALEAEERFIAWEPQRLWAFTIEKTNLPMAKRFTEQLELIETDDSTTVRYVGAFEPLTIMRPVSRLLERNVRRAWTAGLAGLAEHVEGKNRP